MPLFKNWEESSMVEWKKLGDVCDIKGRIGFRGYTRDDQVEKGEGAISLSPGNITNSVLYYDSCTYITWDKFEESPEIMVNEGDILLCKTASVGKVARVRQLPEKATINPQLVLIKNIKTNPQYLFYVLDDNPFQTIIKGLAGVGSVPNVSQAKLSSIQIPVPSLTEQTRIVEILDTFTASIENLKKQIAERRKQYEYYRDQLLNLEGEEGVEMKTLGEVCKLERGVRVVKKDLQEEGSIPVYQNSLIPLGYYDRSNYPPNTSFVICAGAAGEVGFSDKAFWAADDCTCIVCSPLVKSKFVYYFLMVKQFMLKAQVRKASVPRLSKDVIGKISFPLTSVEEQSRIVFILDTFEASIANLEAQLELREKQYEYYRNKLLTFE